MATPTVPGASRTDRGAGVAGSRKRHRTRPAGRSGACSFARAALLGIAALVAGCNWAVQFGDAVVYHPEPARLSLEQAVAGSWRTPRHAARDPWRHPVEVPRFFGLRPDQTVVEIWPGGGYWTEILAPYLRGRGRYIAAHFPASAPQTPDWQRAMVQRFANKLAADPRRYGEVVLAEIGPPDAWQPVPAGSADLVLTFRNVHNWLAGGYAERMFQAFHDMLRPGGTLGVVEHRAAPGTPLADMIRTGYVTEEQVIALARQAGLVLTGRAEINANPRDSRDHPAGVWTLPPTLRLGETDRERYLAIGESDRMTLRFARPVLLAPGDPVDGR